MPPESTANSTPAPALGLVRAAGVVLLALIAGLHLLDLPIARWARYQIFDAYQRASPRERQSAPAVVVAIDEASLARLGQWPWPRTLLARLVERIAEDQPAAIGIDIVMPEPDRLSPARLVDSAPQIGDALARELAALPSNDEVLGRALRGRRVVLGVAGLADGSGRTLLAPPAPPVVLARGTNALGHLRRFNGALASVPEIDGQAAARGLLNAEPEAGIVRRVPLAAFVGPTLVPTLTLELLRVAAGLDAIAFEEGKRGLDRVVLGDIALPTDRDGRLWIHYAEPSADRVVSAADVLTDNSEAGRFQRKLVIVGVTALGLVDRPVTALQSRSSGAEIHAQILENVFDGSLLRRPFWSAWVEFWALVAGGLLLIWVVPITSPRRSAALLIVLVTSAPFAGFAAYQWAHVLVDGGYPALGFLAVFGALLALTLAESERTRARLEGALVAQREHAARVAGELEAAQRIQMGMLPWSPDVLAHERRVDLDAYMEPARQVGGDLYDFFMLDEDHLFVMVGDVSGKGLPAAMFMVLSKSLSKSAALRAGASVAAAVTQANREISRDNPEALFVTLLACVLDLRTGELEYCSAGHDTPLALAPGRSQPLRLPAEGGPPLCVLEGYEYASGACRLVPGETLCLYTDGLTEAQDGAGRLYGIDRLRGLLERTDARHPVSQIAEAIRADVAAFAAGAEPADDLTLLLLRWNGPAPGADALSGR